MKRKVLIGLAAAGVLAVSSAAFAGVNINVNIDGLPKLIAQTQSRPQPPELNGQRPPMPPDGQRPPMSRDKRMPPPDGKRPPMSGDRRMPPPDGQRPPEFNGQRPPMPQGK